MEELLTYSHVDVSFRGNTVVHDVSFFLFIKEKFWVS